MAAPANRGALIVIEGADRTGKSTQSRKLVEALIADGRSAELVKFPDRTTPVGKLVSGYLQRTLDFEDHAVHLLFSANRWEKVPYMLERLQQGTTLVVDRYAFSGVAFTAAKEGFDIEWCKQPDTGLPMPDLVLYLTLPVDQATTRDDYGNERYENTQVQQRATAKFRQLMTKEWKMVDASRSIEDIHQEIKAFAIDTMQKVVNTVTKKLWIS